MLDNWHNIARKLSEKHTVYTVDARNHGQSPHSPEMSYRLMADDVIELADDLGIETFILIGHSMGGKTAMLTADLYPERINKLVVVDIAPKAYAAGHTSYFKAFEEIDWASLNSRKEIDDALAQYEDSVGIRLFLAKNVDRRESGGFEVKSNIPALKNAYEEIIGFLNLSGKFPYPALFITGADSRYLLEADKPSILAHFPRAEFTSIAHAGHWVHADNPTEFVARLDKFLNS